MIMVPRYNCWWNTSLWTHIPSIFICKYPGICTHINVYAFILYKEYIEPCIFFCVSMFTNTYTNWKQMCLAQTQTFNIARKRKKKNKSKIAQLWRKLPRLKKTFKDIMLNVAVQLCKPSYFFLLFCGMVKFNIWTVKKKKILYEGS